jgi:DNA replication protein DnaC
MQHIVEVNASPYRREELHHIGEITRDLIQAQALENITRAYQFMDKVVTECMNDCDDFGRVETQEEGYDAYTLRCPLISLTCDFGKKYVMRARAAALNAVSSTIPARIFNVLEVAEERDVYKVFEQYDWHGALMIHGNKGVGKSVGAAWLMYNAHFKRYSYKLDNENNWIPVKFLWCNTFELLDKDNFNRMKYTPVLIIDDFPESLNAKEQATATEIICKRFDDNKATILTTNSKPAEIALNERAKDRVLGTYSMRVEFTGKSER